MRISDWSSDLCSSDLFHVFFLNTRYELIRGERLASGSIADCQAFPRVIIARALEIGAGAIVLAHNHPSGDLKPSSADRSLTREVTDIARRLEIAVLDHIIVSREGFVSLRKLLDRKSTRLNSSH